MTLEEIVNKYYQLHHHEGPRVAEDYFNLLDLSYEQAGIIEKALSPDILNRPGYGYNEYFHELESKYEAAKPPKPGEAEAVRRTRRLFRDLAPMRQTEIAHSLGTTQPVVSRYMRFERELPLKTYLFLLKILANKDNEI